MRGDWVIVKTPNGVSVCRWRDVDDESVAVDAALRAIRFASRAAAVAFAASI